MRHEQLFSRDKSIVLIIDYQEKFIPVIFNHKDTLKNIKFLIHGVNIYNIPIYVSEQLPEKLGYTHPEIKEITKDAKYFSKKTMSCCGESGFIQEIKNLGIRQVAICGIEAHVCVLQTALDLILHGFQVHLTSDAISVGRQEYNKNIAFEKIKNAGGIISSVETVLFEMAYEAGNEEFKKLQLLFKSR